MVVEVKAVDGEGEEDERRLLLHERKAEAVIWFSAAECGSDEGSLWEGRSDGSSPTTCALWSYSLLLLVVACARRSKVLSYSATQVPVPPLQKTPRPPTPTPTPPTAHHGPPPNIEA